MLSSFSIHLLARMSISNWKWNLAPIVSLFLAFTAAALSAAEKIDLARTEPVPPGEPVPIADFFRPAILQEPKLNLAGTHIAALISADEDQTQLMIFDLKTQTMEGRSYKGDRDVFQVDWLDDQHVIYSLGVRKVFDGGLYVGKVGALSFAYPLLGSVWSSVIAIPSGDRAHPLVKVAANSRATGKYGEVFSVNSKNETGDTQTQISRRYPVLKTDHGFDTAYLADKDGQLAFGFTSEDGVLALHRLVGDAWEKCPLNLEEIDVYGCGDHPGEIVVLGPRQDGKPRPLEVMEAATGKVVEVLLQDKAYDCTPRLYRDPVSHLIVGVNYNRDGPRVTWFDESYRGLQKAVDGLFPGQVVRILGSDLTGKVILIGTYSDRQPMIYSRVDLEKHTAGLIKNSRPWIDPQRMRPMSIVKFKTRDGRQLDAYVTLPVGASKQNPPPLVVIPHDDPSARITWGFDDEAQFLASRGYAVLEPNYRGSNGYNWMFPTDDEWAFRKMHDDVTDATKTLIASGLVDPQRIAIMGTSFGGFLTLSGVAFEPSLYRCAVAISAVGDWAKLIADYKYNRYSSPYYSRMIYKLGDTKTTPEKWEAIAPLRQAERIRVPVFLSTGEYDAPTAIVQSKELASVLERNHVPVESISFINESEGVYHLRHKVELYSRIEAFLAKHLGPLQPGAATSSSP
jgi:dienelactone hydrolase